MYEFIEEMTPPASLISTGTGRGKKSKGKGKINGHTKVNSPKRAQSRALLTNFHLRTATAMGGNS
jgi:hypothetical protein